MTYEPLNDQHFFDDPTLFAYGGIGFEHSVRGATFASIDIETTGLDPQLERIVEIAIVRTFPDGQQTHYSTLVNPSRTDTGPADVHGIVPSDVYDAPTFDHIACDVLNQLDGAIVVAHNAKFEEGFFAAEFDRMDWPHPTVPALCTLALARELVRDIDNYRLATLCDSLGVELHNAHTALGDAQAVADIMPHLLALANITISQVPARFEFPPSGIPEFRRRR